MHKMLYLFLLIFVIRFCSSAKMQRKAALIFDYNSRHLLRKPPIIMNVDILPKQRINSHSYYYFVTGNLTSENRMNVLSIQYKSVNTNQTCGYCPFRPGRYFIFDPIFDSNSVVDLSSDRHIIQILISLCENKNYYVINLKVTIDFYTTTYPPDLPYEPQTNLFSIIFLSSCVALTCFVCIGWFLFIYCRRYRQERIKQKQQKILEYSVQKLLDKMPVIIFNSKVQAEIFSDNDDPMCSICLESFKDNEKIRKLLCPHYFHALCVDPWLLAHQNCPLCNQSILAEAISMISGRFSFMDNTRSNSIDSSIAINHS